MRKNVIKSRKRGKTGDRLFTFFFTVNGFKCALTPFSVVMALLMGVLCVAYTCLGFKIIDKGNMTLYTVFLMIGGVSYLFQLKGAIKPSGDGALPVHNGRKHHIYRAGRPRLFRRETEKAHAYRHCTLFFGNGIIFIKSIIYKEEI